MKGLSIAVTVVLLIWVVALAAEKININTASHEELQEIKWVGPVIAQRIIDARPFYSVQELIRVNGIGEKRLADIKEQGLAWVDPSFKPAQESTTTESATTTQTPVKTAPVVKEMEPSKIDINTASAKDLQKIAGVGKVLAQRIIDARPFYSVDDLAKVRGIGNKTLQDIKTQGLAWVDPSFKPELLKEGLAAAGQQLGSFDDTPEKTEPKRFMIFLIAFFLACLSGAAILIFKNKIKSAYNKEV